MADHAAAVEPMRAFAPYTDPEHLRTLLQECAAQLFGTRVTVTHCTLMDSLYKTYQKPSSWPKSTLSICVRVGLAEPEGSAIFYAKVYLAGRSHAEWARLNQSAACTQPAPPVVHVPALDMIFWRFPHDPSIRHLPRALLQEHVRHHLPFDQLPSEVNGPADLTNVAVEMVKYYPQKCCTTRYHLQWQGASAPQTLTLYGKTYSNDRGRAIHDRLQHFWRAAAFKLAQPLGYDGATHTVWTRGVEGLPLAEVVNRANYKHYLGQVGRDLAAVHSSELGSLDVVSAAELLAEFDKKIDKLSRVYPLLTAQLTAVVTLGHSVGKRLVARPRPARTLHGDFHLGQILAHGNDIYLFDFDSFVLGDPEQDLAEFIVALLFDEFDPAFVRLMALALVESYSAAADWKIQIDCLYWHALVQYVTRAYRFYRQQQPGWADALQRALSNLPHLEAAILPLSARPQH